MARPAQPRSPHDNHHQQCEQDRRAEQLAQDSCEQDRYESSCAERKKHQRIAATPDCDGKFREEHEKTDSQHDVERKVDGRTARFRDCFLRQQPAQTESRDSSSDPRDGSQEDQPLGPSRHRVPPPAGDTVPLDRRPLLRGLRLPNAIGHRPRTSVLLQPSARESRLEAWVRARQPHWSQLERARIPLLAAGRQRRPPPPSRECR